MRPLSELEHQSESNGYESLRSEPTFSVLERQDGVGFSITENTEILAVREKDMSESLTFEARIGDVRVRVLADTGARGRYIDAGVAKRLGLTVRTPDQSVQIDAAGNNSLQYHGTTEVVLDFDSFLDKSTSYKVVGLGEPYDVILGREFWWQYKAAIHYETGGVVDKVRGEPDSDFSDRSTKETTRIESYLRGSRASDTVLLGKIRKENAAQKEGCLFMANQR